MTMDMYLPSLPEITQELNTTQALAQWTISGVMIGSAVGSLFSGPLSDRFGRRRPFFVGVMLHVVMSVLCALAPNITVLLAVRVLQGAGNASATIAAFSALRDRFEGPAQSSGMSSIQTVIAVVPLAAPALGGWIAHHWGWRAVFLTLAAFGVIVIALVYFFLEETNPPERRRRSRASILGAYGPLLRDPRFVSVAIVPAMATTVLITYVSASSFVLQGDFGLSPAEFVIVFSVNGLMIIVSAQINARLVYRAGSARMMWIGLLGATVLSATLLVTAITGIGGLWGFVVPLSFLLVFNFLMMPNAITLALAHHGHRAGAAAALLTALQQVSAGVISPFAGLFGGGAIGMASVICGAVLVALFFASLNRRYERRR